ncbi:MAG: hypothetical protein KDD45_11450, partial [Bdellovibrionales bacterium]|nr:hypothetical protein [Bdellovibrionales bacterium]
MNLFNLKTKSKKLFQASFIFAIFAVLFNNCSQQGDIRLQADPSASTIAPESPTTITPIATEPNDSLGTPNDGSNNDNSGGTSTPENTVKYKTITEQLSVNLTLNNKVDILIVIDNSGSMSYEQSEMAKRFSGFVESLNGLDWQLGITTTDVT